VPSRTWTTIRWLLISVTLIRTRRSGAYEEAGRLAGCAVMGQSGSPEARCELRRPSTRLVDSVAYFPEGYGDGLVRIALEILCRRPVPPALFTRQQLLTSANVDYVYPNDRLMGLTSSGHDFLQRLFFRNRSLSTAPPICRGYILPSKSVKQGAFRSF
jgi:hypothetical protein